MVTHQQSSGTFTDAVRAGHSTPPHRTRATRSPVSARSSDARRRCASPRPAARPHRQAPGRGRCRAGRCAPRGRRSHGRRWAGQPRRVAGGGRRLPGPDQRPDRGAGPRRRRGGSPGVACGCEDGTLGEVIARARSGDARRGRRRGPGVGRLARAGAATGGAGGPRRRRSGPGGGRRRGATGARAGSAGCTRRCEPVGSTATAREWSPTSCEECPAEVAVAVVAALDPHLDDDGPTLRRRTRRLLARISPDLLRQRAIRARAATGLRRWVAEPGVDAWHGTFPSEDAAVAWAAIDRLAHDLVAAGTCSSVEQARGRALTDLVTGNATVDVQVVLTVPADTCARPMLDAVGAGRCRRSAAHRTVPVGATPDGRIDARRAGRADAGRLSRRRRATATTWSRCRAPARPSRCSFVAAGSGTT